MLRELADMFDSLMGPPGIPWDGLIAKGHGIDEGGYDATYMELLLQESFRFFDVIGTMGPNFKARYREIRAQEAREAVTRTQALINQTGADIWQAVKEGEWDVTVALPKTVAEDVLATMAAYAVNAAYMHFDGVVESRMLDKSLSARDAMQHADYAMRTFQAFQTMAWNGSLDEFSGEHGQAGLGLAPVFAWAALGVVALLGICYLLNLFFGAAPLQKKMIEWCDSLASRGDPEDLRRCAAAAESMVKRGNPDLADFLGGTFRPVLVVLGVGAAVYALSLVAPMLKKAGATT